MRSPPHSRKLNLLFGTARRPHLGTRVSADPTFEGPHRSPTVSTMRRIPYVTLRRRRSARHAGYSFLWPTLLLAALAMNHDDFGTWTNASQAEIAHSLSENLRVDRATQKHELPLAKEIKSDPCPPEMVFVNGHYCPNVRHHCLRWLDDVKLPYARCAEYATDVQCLSPRIFLRFCIDREELTRPGEELPENFLSLNRAEKRCQALGKRLCQEREWTFSCEGEAMRPYPYGFSREGKCHQDRLDLFEMRNGKQVLRDLRAKGSKFPACLSSFGILNLVGNVDELVVREGATSTTNRTALKGGWWMPARNRCRAATTAHDADYRDVQVGTRCCKDATDVR